MAEKNRNERELEEFVLVKNEKEPIFREVNVKIVPIGIGKQGPVFEVYDKDDKKIGLVRDDKTFQFDPRYEEELKKSMGGLYHTLGLDKQKLKIDILQEIEREEMQRKIQGKDRKVEQKDSKDSADDKNKERQENEEEKTKSSKIDEKDLKEEKGIEISKVTKIKDTRMLNSMVNNNLDKDSVVVAKTPEGDYQFFAREKGTNEIKPMQERMGGLRYSSEKVNAMNNDKQTKKSAGRTAILPDFGNQEFSIKDDGSPTLDVREIRNIDDKGNREAISIDTDGKKSTVSEYNRLRDERNDRDDEPSNDSILTDEEITERIAKIRNPIVKEMAEKEATDREKNCTKEELKDIIERCNDEYSRENHEPQRERTNNHE